MYWYAQKMSISCSGNRSNLIHFGNPKEAASFLYMYQFAGKIAINKAIMPHDAFWDKTGIHIPMPKTISAIPLIWLSNFGLEK